MTTQSLTFCVNGIPGAQGSKQPYGNGRVESSKKVKPWRQDVKAAAEAALELVEDFGEWPARGPVRVDIAFLFARPQSHYGTGKNALKLRPTAPEWVTSRQCGDLDKILRSSFDALTAAGVIADDSLVVSVCAIKNYTTTGTPGAHITVTQLKGLT